MALMFQANGRSYRAPQRPVLAVCADGWDPDYVDDALERRLMPRLAEALTAGGTYELARAQVPTFTNPNNVAIVTGVSAAHNGVAGNHYLDGSGGEVQVTDPSFLRATTIHAAALQAGVPALCVTAKDKLRRLLATGGRAGLQRRAGPRADARRRHPDHRRRRPPQPRHLRLGAVDLHHRPGAGAC